jgi:GDSL-like Lipase/Acylhydrolase family
VLGDSFTFGSLLSWEDSYVGRLQQAADRELGSNKIEVLNAAVIGWGIADYVAYYEDYGNELGARTVLVFLNTDDVGRSVHNGIYAISEESGSIQRQPPSRLPGARLKSFMNALPFYEFAIERSHLLQLMRFVATMGIRPGAAPAELSSQWENAIVIPRSIPDAASVDSSTRMAKALFRHLFELARDRDHKVIVLTTGWHKFGQPNPAEPTAAFMRIADQFFEENGIYFFDLSDEVYRQSHGTLAKIIIEGDFHPNESGARLISDVAWAALSKCFH